MLKKMHQRVTLLARDLVHLLRGIDAASAHEHRDHRPPGKIIKRVLKIAVVVFFKIPEDPRVELLLVKSGLQVDLHGIGSAAGLRHMRACGEHERTRDAEVREHHLAKLGVDGLAVLPQHGEAHVAQRKALHLGAVGLRAFQRNERGARRRDGVSRRLCKTQSVAGRARRRIGQSARADRSRAALDAPRRCLHGSDGAVSRDDALRGRLLHLYARADERVCKGVCNIVCAVGDRKHAIAALDLQRHAEGFKKRLRVLRRKPAERAVQKPSLAGDVLQKGFHVAVVRDVAAPLARDAHLAPELAVRLQQHDLRAAARGGIGAHHTGGAAADDNNISVQASDTPRILTRCPPDHGRSGAYAHGHACRWRQ